MLTIEQLSHTYPNGVRALRGVSLEVPRGMFGLLGPNGAGKSSLMRTIATLQQPTSGELRFGEIDILREPLALRRVLGYLPQDFGVYPRGSAYDLLDHLAVLKGLADRRERKKEVERLLVQTNLWPHRRKRVAGFSGGMRQRFGVAQALLGRPELIIVDEPTAGLDPEERNRFHNLLAEIGEEIVVILSTHIVEDVADLCPRMAILACGQVVLAGTPAQLREELDGKVWTRRIDKADLASVRQRFNLLSHHLSMGSQMVRVLAESCPGPGFEATPATLEDVYFSAVEDRGNAGQSAAA